MLYPNPTITGFGDALSVALELFERFGDCTGALLLDDWGAIVDAGVCADGHPIDCIVTWAEDTIGRDTRIGAVVLLSGSTDRQPRDLCADDVDHFHHLRDRFDLASVELRDWLITDGDDIRSMAFSCLIDAGWSDQSQ